MSHGVDSSGMVDRSVKAGDCTQMLKAVRNLTVSGGCHRCAYAGEQTVFAFRQTHIPDVLYIEKGNTPVVEQCAASLPLLTVL